jgi:hypothetical protein
MKTSVVLVALLSCHAVVAQQTIPARNNVVTGLALTEQMAVVGNMTMATKDVHAPASRSSWSAEVNSTSSAQSSSTATQNSAAPASNLAAETAVSQRLLDTEDRPAQASQTYGHVETWCCTWWGNCAFSHLGPATGLVDGCFSIWEDGSKYGVGYITVTPTVGTAISGLLDDNYTLRIQEGRTFLVSETRDAVSTEAALGVTISRSRSRHAIYTGVGVARGGSGRGYVGYGYRIGSAAVLSIGAAIGTVKRLSSAFREGDVVTIPPQSLTRDSVRVAPFLSLNYRIGALF